MARASGCGPDLAHQRERLAALDRAFTTAPDDIVLGWELFEELLLLHRDSEAVAVARTLHQRRPDLQFGSDLQQVLTTTGHPDDAAAVQREWMRVAPDNDQAWSSQIYDRPRRGGHAEAMHRSARLLVLYGRTPTRIVMLVETALAAGDLAEATTQATSMLRGSDFERSMGWFNLGKLDLLQGHFSAALEAWRTGALKARPLGTQGPELQTLEELSALEQYLDDPEGLTSVLDRVLEIYTGFGDQVRLVGHRIVRGAVAKPRVCPDLAAMMRDFAGEGRASFERAASRAAASTGCGPCSAVVKLGGSRTSVGRARCFASACAPSTRASSSWHAMRSSARARC